MKEIVAIVGTERNLPIFPGGCKRRPGDMNYVGPGPAPSDPPTEAESNLPPEGHFKITDDTALELSGMVSNRVTELTGQPITESEDAHLAIAIGRWLKETLAVERFAK